MVALPVAGSGGSGQRVRERGEREEEGEESSDRAAGNHNHQANAHSDPGGCGPPSSDHWAGTLQCGDDSKALGSAQAQKTGWRRIAHCLTWSSTEEDLRGAAPPIKGEAATLLILGSTRGGPECTHRCPCSGHVGFLFTEKNAREW